MRPPPPRPRDITPAQRRRILLPVATEIAELARKWSLDATAHLAANDDAGLALADQARGLEMALRIARRHLRVAARWAPPACPRCKLAHGPEVQHAD